MSKSGFKILVFVVVFIALSFTLTYCCFVACLFIFSLVDILAIVVAVVGGFSFLCYRYVCHNKINNTHSNTF